MVFRPIAAGTLLLATCLAAGRVARAADPHPAADTRTEQAREHYLQGDAYYKLDKYANALQEYEQAYLAKQDPSFLYNIAQCHRLMGQKAEAVKFYRRYLKDAPTAPNRAVAEKHIKDLEASGGADAPAPAPAVSPVSPPAATSPPPVAPAAAVAVTPPPPATMPAPVAASQAVTPLAPGGTALALNAPPPPASDAPSGGTIGALNPPSTEKSRPIYTKWWFWTGIGVVLVGGLLIALAGKHDPSCPTGRICE